MNKDDTGTKGSAAFECRYKLERSNESNAGIFRKRNSTNSGKEKQETWNHVTAN